MSPEAFALGMARMEQLFLGRALTAPERRVYQAALATLTDSRFEVLVQYALTNWRKPGEMPLPGMLRQRALRWSADVRSRRSSARQRRRAS